MIHFEIDGRPRPYSERQTTRVLPNGKRRTWSYRSDALKGWQELVRWEAIRVQEQVPPPNGPIELTLEFYLKRPKTKSHKPCDEPYPTRFKRDADLTNLVKGVEDSLEKILFENDVQVVDQHNKKRWSKDGRQYAVVTVREI